MVGIGSSFIREAYEAIESFDRRCTPDGVVDVMQRALARFGFEYFCINIFPNPDQQLRAVTLANRVPEEWRRIYVKERYADVNPTIRHCRRTGRPFRWNDAPYDPEGEPRVAEFIQRVTDFGLSGGLVFPISEPQRCTGFVWMGVGVEDSVGSDMPILHLMALYAFDRVRRLRAPSSTGCLPLTVRERDVLAWVAQGKSAWEIGEILGIAARTVNEHVQTACRKLNAANRTQAVVAALRERFIAL